MLVREVMTSPAITVTEYTTAREALRLLGECRITALPVVDDDGIVVGVVSEADLLALIPDGPQSDPMRPDIPTTRRIRELMTHPAVTVDADSEVIEAVKLMRSTVMKSLPVVLNGRIVGVVSRSDLVRVLTHTDDRLRDEVNGLIRAEGVNWLIDVTNGVVTINGPVTERQRREAEAIVRSVTGVVDVRIPW
jgi:CBS domain-containing protein